MRSLLATSVIVLLRCVPASAQYGNPAGLLPGTPESAPGVPVGPKANQTDRLFVVLVATGGMAEVDLGRLAGERARSDAVKAFGRRMVEDHGKGNEQLADFAKQHEIALPKELGPEHKAVRDELEKLSGADFDLEYIKAQVQDHQKTVQLLTWEIDGGQDPRIQKFASDNLAIVFDHLRVAQDELSRLRKDAAK